MSPHPALDRRGASTVITHVLAIGITGVLITGLLMGASDFVESHRERTATQELEAVGNQLAMEVDRIDSLERNDSIATVRSSVPDAVAGNTYDVRIGSGSECDARTIDSEYCLVLQADALDVTRRVPIQNETKISLDRQSGNAIRLRSDAPERQLSDGGSTGTDALAYRIGVGASAEPLNEADVVNPTDRAPYASFSFSPGMPNTNTNVYFDASESEDVDGTIVDYTWTVKEGGPTFSTVGPSLSYNYNDPGEYTVTLEVTDDAGNTGVLTRTVTVSGLEYNHDMDQHKSDDELTFSVHNNWDSAVEITSIRFNPPEEFDEIDHYQWDVGINVDDDNGMGNSGNDDVKDVSEDIPQDGKVVRNLNALVGADDDARIRLRGFDTSVHEAPFAINITYEVGGQRNTTWIYDSSGGLDVIDYDVVENGGSKKDIDAVLKTSEEVSSIDVEVDHSEVSDFELDRSDFTHEGCSDDVCTYRADVVDDVYGETSTVLTQVINDSDGQQSFDTPLHAGNNHYNLDTFELYTDDFDDLKARIETENPVDELSVDFYNAIDTELDEDDFTGDCTNECTATVTTEANGVIEADIDRLEDTDGVATGRGFLYSDHWEDHDRYEKKGVLGDNKWSWESYGDWKDDDGGTVVENIRLRAGGHHTNQDTLKLGYDRRDARVADDDELLTYFQFDDNSSGLASDWSRYDHHASVDGADEDPAGLLNTPAFAFDGNGDRVEDIDAENYLEGRDEFAVSMWVKPAAAGTDRGLLVGQEPDGTDTSFYIRQSTSSCSECYKAGVAVKESNDDPSADYPNLVSQADEQTTDWHHVMFTWDGDGGWMDMYVNGTASVQSADTAKGFLDDLTGLWIGQGPQDDPTWDDGFEGTIDEVRLYNESLDPGHAEQLYDVTDGETSAAWKQDFSIDPEHVGINSTTDVESHEAVQIRIVSDKDDGSGNYQKTDWITLPDGSNKMDVPSGKMGSLTDTSTTYHLDVKLETDTITTSPKVQEIVLYNHTHANS
jgi:hypothetical protein